MNGELSLKCDAVPKAAAPEIQTISAAIAATTTPAYTR